MKANQMMKTNQLMKKMTNLGYFLITLRITQIENEMHYLWL